mmetsp:Transcript_3458/g.8553  ORF Transcript_3458/g.8553 Transcript_3458/m.8553 type:complete len:264 (-) Transcript_3458:1932-2723(-)
MPHKSSDAGPIASGEAARNRRVLSQASDRLLHRVVGTVVQGHSATQVGKLDLGLLASRLSSCEAYPAIVQHQGVLPALLVVGEVEAGVGGRTSGVLSEEPVQVEAHTIPDPRVLELSAVANGHADGIQPGLVPSHKPSPPEEHSDGPLDLLLPHEAGQPADDLESVDPPSPPPHVVLLLQPLHHHGVKLQTIRLPIVQDLHLPGAHEEHGVPDAVLVRGDVVALHDGIRKLLVVKDGELPGEVLLQLLPQLLQQDPAGIPVLH